MPHELGTTFLQNPQWKVVPISMTTWVSYLIYQSIQKWSANLVTTCYSEDVTNMVDRKVWPLSESWRYNVRKLFESES